MFELSDYPIFENHKGSLKEASKDDHDGVISYMTESLYQVVLFDEVKDEYVEGLKLATKPKSNDALLALPDGRLVFVEFKNGYMDKEKQFGVRKKIYDSLLIFADITQKGISYTRADMDYVLVYNEERNPNQAVDAKTQVRSSASRDEIANRLTELGGETYVKFGLDIFKNYCFKNVFVYNKHQFEERFIANL